MRPTSSTMLQQNNNNNYPCLNKSDSTQQILQKCSRTSLLFPSRLELGDLPLVRGLRAWALCSKNRHKAGGLLGGGKAPTAPPPGRRSSTSCPRPADVYLSRELGRMGYGLPLGLDARALVTVATLKPSEGSGKTQTQCLFLRTEKGSCLYSTSKPSPGGAASAAPSMVGEWLKGKTGGGAESPPAQDGPNRVRVRSGRRWRKSGNVATVQEKRERRQTTEPTAEERQEEQNKGGPDPTRFSSPQQNSSRTGCCHSVSPATCSPCGKRPQRRRSPDERGKTHKLMGHPETSSQDVDEDGGTNEAPRIQESRTETSQSRDDFTETEDVLRKCTEDDMETRNDPKPGDDFCQETEASDDGSENQMESVGSADSLRPQESSAPVEGSVCSSHPDPDLSSVPEPNFAAEEGDFVTEDSNGNRKASVSSKAEDWKSQLEEKETSETERRTVEGQDVSTSIRLDGAEAEASEEEEEEEEEEEGDYKGDWSLESEESWRNEDLDVSGQTVVTCVFNPGALFSPAPSLLPLVSMATGLLSLEAKEEEEEEKHEAERGDERRRRGEDLEERGSTVAPEEEEEEEEDEFGVFMQAEGEPAWSEGVNMSASVPCGSRGRTEPGNGTVSEWTGGSLQQSDDTWTAFPQDPSGSGGDVEQWWPASAVEAARGQLWTNHSPNKLLSLFFGLSAKLSSAVTTASVFTEAFPSPPAATPGDPGDLEAVPTLTQLLGGGASQDQRLLNNFHDLNKIIGRSYKRASRASRDLLLKTLRLQPPVGESRPASWTTNRRLSPGLPSANQNAHQAAAKRRLSYDYNRNAVE